MECISLEFLLRRQPSKMKAAFPNKRRRGIVAATQMQNATKMGERRVIQELCEAARMNRGFGDDTHVNHKIIVSVNLLLFTIYLGYKMII